MFSFVQNWFAPAANPIGVDFGSECLRMAQVEAVGGEKSSASTTEYRLVAAASAEVPASIGTDPAERMAFLTETLRELMTVGKFRGRRAVLCLPAAAMFIQHLRMPRMDGEALTRALPWEARGKLPIDPAHALLRHIVAGEVYQEQEPKDEVILLAAKRELVDQLLSAAGKARIDVVGLNVEPKALLDCFNHVYRRKSDENVTNCFVDIGSCGTRAVIARGAQILFARSIPLGGEHLTRAVSGALRITPDEARALRIKIAAAQSEEPRDRQQIAEAPAGSADGERRAIEAALHEPLAKLVEELSLCRRYHEATFTNSPVERLIFVGGEARHRGMCQQIARELGVAAQVGDPLVRMGRISEIGIESGIDRRLPQPSWAVAIGLSMGPARVEVSPASASAMASARV